ncbi:hypothetical protein WAK64_22200 [Bacillus spongiae]|uniref:Class I SAM-dependent methyltransferase n=1 Tax=Bacillus spongiae TaxID=2683610 RepID=A0ABU8HKM6_9BACI
MFQLVTIAKAFHWMDRPSILDELFDMVHDNGGVAIIDSYEANKKLTKWQAQLKEIIEKWYGKERRAGKTTYTHPTMSHEEVISNSKFTLKVHRFPSYDVTWTVESIIGNLYSTSYGCQRFVKITLSHSSKLREALLTVNRNGIFKESLNLSVKLAVKK